MLQIFNLHISLATENRRHHLLQGAELDLKPGEMVGVAGASGAGKSLLARAVIGLLPAGAHTQGDIVYQGRPLDPRRLPELLGREIAYLPQSVQALNPLQRIGRQLHWTARLRGKACSRQDLTDTLKELGLDKDVLALYPHQLSGGMARRVLLAMALMGKPRLVVADEPLVGLDRELAFEMLGLLRQVCQRGGGVLLISHDLKTLANHTDRVAILYRGTTMEWAKAHDFMQEKGLAHPYSRLLWQALPENGFIAPGSPRGQDGQATGICHFLDQCPVAAKECRHSAPPLTINQKRLVRCHAPG